MSDVLQDIIAITGRDGPHDEEFVRHQYLLNRANIRCTVAVDGADNVLGFQSLFRAEPGNRFDAPEGWGIIGTHIGPHAHRQGVGRALFAASRAAAAEAGIEKIDAYISADNVAGLCYYEALGFRTYREPAGIVQKVYSLR